MPVSCPSLETLPMRSSATGSGLTSTVALAMALTCSTGAAQDRGTRPAPTTDNPPALHRIGAPSGQRPEREQATGPMRTFRQRDWARPCDTSVAGCLLHAHFGTLFPRGLVVGDRAGVNQDQRLALVLTSAEAVAELLPKSGDPKVLARNLVDPPERTRGTGGSFAGQVLAAKLNVACVDRGLLPRHASGHALGDLLLTGDVSPALRGRSVRALLDLADACLAGDHGRHLEEEAVAARRLDLDGNGQPDTSLLDVYFAVRAVNENHDGRGVDRGRLIAPAHAPADPGVIWVGPGSGKTGDIVAPRPVLPGGGLDPTPRTDPKFEIRDGVPDKRLKPQSDDEDDDDGNGSR